MEKYILLTEKPWHKELFVKLKKTISGDWLMISNQEDFTISNLASISPSKIFIPHWSYIIPKKIYSNFECIVFHMTDLPFGRGGSPLQNLIVRGFNDTKISAIRVEKGIDTGPIYLKKNLSLEGTAKEIHLRASKIMKEMIEQIIREKITSVPQKGKSLVFKRRKPEDGNIADLKNLKEVYDYIRMLDCEGYPPAFLEIGQFRLEFTQANFENENLTLNANVRITKK